MLSSRSTIVAIVISLVRNCCLVQCFSFQIHLAADLAEQQSEEQLHYLELIQVSADLQVAGHPVAGNSTALSEVDANQTSQPGSPKNASQSETGQKIAEAGLAQSQSKEVPNWLNDSLVPDGAVVETPRGYEPKGIISNVYGGNIVWWWLDRLSYRHLMSLSIVVYPAAVAALLLVFMFIVSVFLRVNPEVYVDNLAGKVKILRVEDLAPISRSAYRVWAFLCYFIPGLLVFGTCGFVFGSLLWRPQESYVILMSVGSFFFYSISVHQVCHVPFLLHYIAQMDRAAPEDIIEAGDKEAASEVQHWLFLPNYKEEVETMEMALDSAAASSIAKEQINIVLAMEEREVDAVDKANRLRAKYADKFRDILITFHPPDLPNDPPGKASNVCWAFARLTDYVRGDCQEAWEPEKEADHEDEDHDTGRSRQTESEVESSRSKALTEPRTPRELEKMVLTIADADSCFHRLYFEALTKDFIQLDEVKQKRSMWQAPIYHMKNYHVQPGPVAVGSIFTGMMEGSVLADPLSVRFPYSTYSLSMSLAESVGGWDSQWIAEDWHMGIKCYLLTLARMQLRPIYAPTINYTPEAPDQDYWGTIWARITQAKRHALGFSDMAYLFMTLPLIFQYLLAVDSFEENISHFPRLVLQCVLCIIRLINTHVFIGVLLIYGLVTLVMGLAPIESKMLSHGSGLPAVFTVASFLLVASSAIIFTFVYERLRPRLDPPLESSKGLFQRQWLHSFYVMSMCAVMGPLFFVALAYCAWNAALQCAKNAFSNEGFHYEVAPKPVFAKKDQELPK
mmetsp:Transcript_28729/g.66681  ORF Transcript_28729/g.66681 Transcript_28729/m.66681 type:complete len:792 (+) Transcript_28729:85-2460(+)